MPSATQPAARELMNRALMAEPGGGTRVTVFDRDHASDRDRSYKEARSWQKACNGAKRDQRLSQRAAAISEGTDPALATRTEYDKLVTTIDRRTEDDGWTLTIRQVTLDGLLLEDF